MENTLMRRAPLSALIPALVASMVALALGSGTLSLQTQPSEAETWYSSQYDSLRHYLGNTPLEGRELPAGSYSLWLILPGHDTLALAEVAIVEGQQTRISRDIPTHYNSLEVATDPDSAQLWLDGVRLGFSPYANGLLLPGSYVLRARPRDSRFLNSSRAVTVSKGDSARVRIIFPFRDKSFLAEGLSLPPWRMQWEAGAQYRSLTGYYDGAGRNHRPPLGARWQQDFPLAGRLGLPAGVEIHFLAPFKTFDGKDPLAPFPSNARVGAKYTYRPLGLGLDASYGIGVKDAESSLNHDFLALTALAAASRGKFLGLFQAGFEFHFREKQSGGTDPGDQARAHVQVGYLADPVTPYLAFAGHLRLAGEAEDNSTEEGGYVLSPEPGLILDLADRASFQLGIPFTLSGKGGGSAGGEGFWGIHGSVAFGYQLK